MILGRYIWCQFRKPIHNVGFSCLFRFREGILSMRRAILSVSDKTGLIPFGQGLVEPRLRAGLDRRHGQGAGRRGPAGGQRQRRHRLPRNDGRPRQDAASQDPRRHPRAPRSSRGSRRLPAQHGIGLVDLVVVNLYPFVETAAKPGIEFDDLIEQIDIGGPSLVRAASKNFQRRADRRVAEGLRRGDRPSSIATGGPSPAFRFELARRAFEHTGAYDTAIASTLGEVKVEGDAFRTRQAPSTSSTSSTRAPDDSTARKLRDLRYGENPHQPAAWYALEPPAGLGAPAILQGKELSFTNLLDLDAAARIVARVRRAGGGGDQAHQSVRRRHRRDDRRSLRARARSGFARGVRRHHRPQSHARRRDRPRDRLDLHRSGRRSRRRRRGARRFSRRRPTSASSSPISRTARAITREYRSILGAMLVQERDRVIEAQLPWPADGIKVVTKRQPTAEEWQAMRFAWRVMAHVKSNTVIFTDAVRTLAIGAGQMSRVDAVKVAVHKAGGWKGGSAPTLQGIGRRIGCVLPVPRWARCRRRRRRHRGRAAGRIGEGCGSDRRRG